jgi:hypothetical protein
VPQRRRPVHRRQAREVKAKGGAIEWIHWQSGAAQLLPRLIADRTEGPAVPHRAPRARRDADTRRLPGHRPGPAVLSPSRGDLRGVHPAAGQPPRPLRPVGRPAGLHAAPLAACPAQASRVPGGRYLTGQWASFQVAVRGSPYVHAPLWRSTEHGLELRRCSCPRTVKIPVAGGYPYALDHVRDLDRLCALLH